MDHKLSINSSYQLSSQKESTSSVYKDLIKASLQTGISFSLEYLPNTITIYFLEKTENQVWVGGFGYGQLLCQAFGLAILNGIGCGLETLVSQAYGAQKFDLCGKLYYRALYISTLLMIPISILLLCSGTLISLINDNKELTDATGEFNQYMVLAVFLNGIFVNTKVFLNGQGIYDLQLITQSITCLCSIGISYYLIIYLNWGLAGCALSRTLLEILNNIILFSLIKLKNCCKETIVKFEFNLLKHSWIFIKIAAPIGSILWLEWICYEFYTMQASYLDSELLSVNVIMNNAASFFYQFSYGISIAATTFVGQEMGSNSISLAKKYSLTSLILMAVFLLLSQTPIFIFRDNLASFVSNNNIVMQNLISLMPLMIFFIILDACQCVLSGIMRGVGKEKQCSLSFILSYLVIGQISAYILCFYFDLSLKGIWYGMSIGTLTFDIFIILSLIFNDWEKLALSIARKVNALSVNHQGSQILLEEEQ